jgi:hypothetical protein
MTVGEKMASPVAVLMNEGVDIAVSLAALFTRGVQIDPGGFTAVPLATLAVRGA